MCCIIFLKIIISGSSLCQMDICKLMGKMAEKDGNRMIFYAIKKAPYFGAFL